MTSETPEEGPRTPFAPPRRKSRFGRRRALFYAALLTVGWLVCLLAYAAGFFGFLGGVLVAPRPVAALEAALFILAAIAPPSLFFYGALLAEKAEEIRSETARLSSAIDALRHSVAPRSGPVANELAQALTAAARTTLAEEKAALAAGLAGLDATLAQTQEMMAELRQGESKASRKAKKTAPPRAVADAAQPGLPFEGEAPPDPDAEIPWESVIKALNFPRDENDEAGFAVIRDVVVDREFADLLQAAEDALTFLAGEGLYMEDLETEPADLEVWAHYAEGGRGAPVAAIGGVTDEVALALTRTRVKGDPVFRDAAMHFLRRYDRLVERMTAELGPDPMLREAADTRTGRAFQLIARVMGVFD